MVITIKTGMQSTSAALCSVLRAKGWTNPNTVNVTRLQTTVTIEMAEGFCSFPHLLQEVTDAVTELGIGR